MSFFNKVSGGKLNKTTGTGILTGNVWETQMMDQARKNKDQAKKNKQGQARLQDEINDMMGTRPKGFSMTRDGGKLKDNFKGNVANYNSNLGQLDQRLNGIGDVNAGANFGDAQGGINYLQDQAYSEGPSTWANSQFEFQNLQDQGAREDLSKNADRSKASAYSQLAMRGGLDSGARERLAESFGNNLTDQQQMQGRNNQMAMLGIKSQDESNKMNLARDLPGMNLQMDQYSTGLQDQNRQADFAKVNAWGSMADGESSKKFAAENNMEQFNKGNAMNAVNTQNNRELDGWNSQMSAFAAGKSGDAMSKAGDKKSNNPVGKIFG